MERNCKNCKNQDCFWVGADDDDICDEYLPKTNADKIRSMEDKELANWFTGFCISTREPYATARSEMLRGKLLAWLKQECAE